MEQIENEFDSYRLKVGKTYYKVDVRDQKLVLRKGIVIGVTSISNERNFGDTLKCFVYLVDGSDRYYTYSITMTYND